MLRVSTRWMKWLSLWFVLCAVAGCSAPSPQNHESTGEIASALTASIVSIAVTPDPVTLPAAVTQAFRATATLSNGKTKALTTGVVWTSDNGAVATVDGAGVATTKAPGVAVVTVRDTASNKSATATVDVSNATLASISLTPKAKNIPAGTTQKMTATGIFSDSSKVALKGAVATWVSSTPTVATIDATGLVSAVAPGVTTITVTHVATNTRESTTLTVGTVTLSSVLVSPANVNIPNGTTQHFTARATYSDGSVVDVTTMASWTSSKATVATVADGDAAATGNGASTITATFNTLKSAATLTVGPITLKSIALSPPAPNVALGGTITFVATGTYIDNSTRNLTDTVTWSSTNKNVFTISNAAGEQGKITTVASGLAKAKAVDPVTGITATTPVNVTAATLVSIFVNPPFAPRIPVGFTYPFYAQGRYSDGTFVDMTSSVTWSVSGTSNPHVSNAPGSEGQVTPTSLGTLAVQATDPVTGLVGARDAQVVAAVMTRLEVTPASLTIPRGVTQQFVATAVFSDGRTQDVTAQSTWTSTNPGDLFFLYDGEAGPPGLARAVVVGSTTVEAHYDLSTGETFVATSAVDITPAAVSGLRFKLGTLPHLTKGATRGVVAQYLFTDGSFRDANGAITWSSSDPSILDVSNASLSQGFLTALAVGQADITATDPVSGYSTTLRYTVHPALLVGIDAVDDLSLAKGLTAGVRIIAHYSDGSTFDITEQVLFTSDDPAIAVIESGGPSAGRVTAVDVGTIGINAETPGGPEVYFQVTVTPAVVSAITIAHSSTLAVGTTESFRANATFTDGTTVDITESALWSSSVCNVANVSNAAGRKGEVKAHNRGSTTVTARDPATGVTAALWLHATSPAPRVTAGGYHTCALLEAGGIKCWGYNGDGELGVGDTAFRGDQAGEMGVALPMVSLGTASSDAWEISSGVYHSCAILHDGRVKCWGYNPDGRLGLGDTRDRGVAPGDMGDALPYVDLGTGRTAKLIAAGADHTCALLDNDRIKCWGANSYGQLGTGNGNWYGYLGGQMGNNLPYVDLGTGRTAKRIAATESRTCAILDDDSLKCWGWNANGELGLGDVAAHGGGAGQMGNALPTVDLGAGRRAKDLAMSGNTTCVILDDGQLKCWGTNGNGALGLGDSIPRGGQAGQMGDALSSVDLGAGRRARSITAGYTRTCAVLDDRTVKCWGQSSLLGIGRDDASRGDDPGEMGSALPVVDLGTGRTAKAISIGGRHTCSVLDDDTVKCWGDTPFGQVGRPYPGTVGDAFGEMGDANTAVDLAICPYTVQGGVCCLPAPSGMLAWWRGESDATDRLHGHDGTVDGAVSYVPGRVGTAFGFSGAGGIAASAIGLPLGSADRTIEAWVRIDEAVEGEHFFAGYGAFGTFDGSFGLGAGGEGTPFFSQWGNGIGGPTLTFGTWSHVGVTTSGTHASLYVDGVQVSEADMTIDTGAGDFFIGAIPGDAYRRLHGAVDEVSIYDRVLSAGEMAAIHSVGGGGKCQ